MFNLQDYATAQNCFDAMVEKYGLEEYVRAGKLKTALEIGNIRYELTRLLFSVSHIVGDLSLNWLKRRGGEFVSNLLVCAFRIFFVVIPQV